MNSGARPPSPPLLVPAPGRIPTGQTGRGRRGPLPPRKVQPVQARGRRGRGRGKSPSGRGVNPAAPRPAIGGGEGNPGPLRRSNLAGKRGAEGKDGPLKERRRIGEGGRKMREPLHSPPSFPPSSTPGLRPRRRRVPKSPLSHLKAARSKVGNKKFLFRTFGLRFGTLRLSAGGGARSRTGEGRCSSDPESRAPHLRPALGHPVTRSPGAGHAPP